MLMNFSISKILESRLRRFAPILALLIAQLGLFACNSGSKTTPPLPARDRDSDNLIEETEPEEPEPVVEEPENLDVELLQRAVARVLGFVDVQDRSVIVYQDAYSALYEKHGDKSGSDAPKLFHSPIFVAKTPRISLLPDGNFSVSIDNRFPPSVLRDKIKKSLDKPLYDLEIYRQNINVVPLDNITAKINAFGKLYDCYSVPKDLSNMTCLIPKDDVVPQSKATALAAAIQADPTGDTPEEAEFLQLFESMVIDFIYYVQQVERNTCKVNVAEEQLSNVFANSDGCPITKDPTIDAEEKARLTAINPEWSDMDQLVAQASKPITRCLVANEVARINLNSSVECTTQQDENGNRKDNPLLDNFVAKTVEPIFAQAGDYKWNTDDWSSELMAKAIAMFGDHENFMSEVTQMSADLQEDFTQTNAEEVYQRAYEFFDKFEEHANIDAGANSSANSDERLSDRSTTNTLGIPGISGNSATGVQGNNTTATAQYTEEFKEFFDQLRELTRNQSGTEAEDALNKYFEDRNIKAKGYQNEGTWRIFPEMRINVKVDQDKIRNLAQDLSDNSLGRMVTEQDQLAVAFREQRGLSLEVAGACNDAAKNNFSTNFKIKTAYWYDSPDFFRLNIILCQDSGSGSVDSTAVCALMNTGNGES